MNCQRSHPTIMPLYRPHFRTKPLLILLLVFLFNLSSYPLYAEQVVQSAENSVSALIEKYGKGFIVKNILYLRKAHITVDINGTLRDSSGRPQHAYITPRSVLRDIQQAGMSVEQFAALLHKTARAEAARNKAEKAEAAGIEEERKRIARKLGLDETCGVQVETRNESVKDLETWFEYAKRGGKPDMKLLIRNFKTAYFMIGMVDKFCSQYPHIIRRNRRLGVELDNLQQRVIDVMSGKG